MLRRETHERTVVAALFCRIKKPFNELGWDVDVEYNREGDMTDSKGDDKGKLIPDIVLHHRGLNKRESNLLALEVKGFWNEEDREKDVKKLQRLHDKYRYKYLYRIEFGPTEHDLIQVAPHSLK